MKVSNFCANLFHEDFSVHGIEFPEGYPPLKPSWEEFRTALQSWFNVKGCKHGVVHQSMTFMEMSCTNVENHCHTCHLTNSIVKPNHVSFTVDKWP